MENLSEHQFESTIQSGKPIVIEFSAPWCPDCLYLNPFLPEIVKNNPEFTFYHMDRDENLDLCEKLDVLGIPSFIIFNKGKEIARFVSTLRKTPQEIQAFLNQAKEKLNG